MELLRTRLRRSAYDEVIAGVLGGLAEFFGVSARRVRIAFVIATIVSGGLGIITYLLLYYVMPDDLSRSP
ncbi:MAG: PspC domain-containing protein [Gemmatimonadaceae bacterium]